MVQATMKSHPWDLPGSADDYGVEWNMWPRRDWPYLHIEDGDIVFTVSGGGLVDGTIQAECRVDHVVKAYYDTHEDAWQALKAGIPTASRDGLQKREFMAHGYTRDAPQAGYLLAMTFTPVRQLNIPRPDGLKLRPNGWASWEVPAW